MDYNLVAQVDDNDAASQSGDSDIADHPSVEPASSGHQAHESIASVQQGRGNLIDSINPSDINHSSSYELIEDDDYAENVEQNKPIPAAEAHSARQISTAVDLTSIGAEIAPRSTEPLVRTSSDVSIPLRHPTPDLQSLQGAYVGNIERLEKSAERLSMTSSDLGVELRKLDLEQKRRSSASSAHQGPDSPSTREMSIGSLSNSIIAVNSAARSGGYSPGGFLTSPRGSIISGSRFRSTSVTSPLQEIHEPGHEEEMETTAVDTFDDRDVPILTPRPLPAHARNNEVELHNPYAADETFQEAAPDRPLTAQSTDTYQQVTNLFLDFDGVHFVPHPKEPGLSRQLSLNRPPLATSAEPLKEPQAGKDMVFYPAPIPKFLNLPQRLSKQSAKVNNEKRRTQLMGMISAADKEAKAEEIHDQRASKRLSTLPPQLRASVFFDQPSSNLATLEVQLKDRSAVSTLDSILDASTHAPVSAFTDHPIVGSAGAKVYGSADKKRASRLLAGKGGKDGTRTGPGPRESAFFVPGQGLHAYSDTEAAEGDPMHPGGSENKHGSHSPFSSDAESSGTHDSEEDTTDEEDDDEEDGISEPERFDNDESMLFGRPTTLLAELQMRKEEQKQRNRSAAKAFPNGMHSTLLELDAVAQAQSNKRRQKHVTLAWEAEAAVNPDDADDEDIPLGILYGNKNPAEEERPLGLMERRELEENEPLSKRRARLRGEAIPTAMPNKRASAMTRLQSSAAPESDSEDEGETLAQRLRRLKQEKKDKTKSVISTEFETEIMNELGRFLPNKPVAKEPEPTTKAVEKVVTNEEEEEEVVVVEQEEEETLAQRRKRLQAEAAQAQSKNVRASRSMADILSAYPASKAGFPVSGNAHARQTSLRPGSVHTQRLSTGFTVPPSMTFHAGLAQTPNHHPSMPDYETQPAYGNMPYNAAFMPGVAAGMTAYGASMQYPHNATMMQQNIIDPRQADIIDRWRQSIGR
ncbi:hypothetical protein EYB25_007830 [Talaromyces marneffei]|uniref:uncharacterized protein n=1 Tax=Talaromyces marneffei TaxID=37727 RepID=UPI0012A9E951|nr:uncharacterized protein EYB26_005383 [Talaromyces marneffei]KAE8549310.1 hypothetical protein EYB25_007830 [Talaromyces marneffei]QGA17708.1 hypothetical protein EYB26_005383 [Talaromyces marneffei]